MAKGLARMLLLRRVKVATLWCSEYMNVGKGSLVSLNVRNRPWTASTPRCANATERYGSTGRCGSDGELEVAGLIEGLEYKMVFRYV